MFNPVSIVASFHSKLIFDENVSKEKFSFAIISLYLKCDSSVTVKSGKQSINLLSNDLLSSSSNIIWGYKILFQKRKNSKYACANFLF